MSTEELFGAGVIVMAVVPWETSSGKQEDIWFVFEIGACEYWSGKAMVLPLRGSHAVVECTSTGQIRTPVSLHVIKTGPLAVIIHRIMAVPRVVLEEYNKLHLV